MPQLDNQLLASLRVDYSKKTLSENETHQNPIEQFKIWFSEALTAQVPEPNIMTLATVKPDGSPNARIVLLKGVTENGFTFFTNYHSSKGQEIEHNNKVSLVFWWLELQRQVRIDGTISKLDDVENDEYFYSRPKESQLGAIASPQSSIISSRKTLEDNYSAAENNPIIRPTHWGGYLILPNKIEFWQGRPSRLHDRIEYQNVNNSWVKHRLAP